jgi:hypothetical protein
MAGKKETKVVTFEFPIRDPEGVVQMQSIPPSNLPNFHGLENEDPDAFLFQFEVLCRGYGYFTNDQKLNVFPLTLKGTSLRWFMSLGGNSIQTWEDMKYVFLQRYQDYCRVNDDIFGMTQGEEESLEEYVERFQYNLQRSKQKQLGKETLKILLLKGIHDESLEILNLMGTGDVFQLPYDDICELCRRYSRGNFKTGKNSSEPSSQYFKSTAKTRAIGVEISNSIEIFKDDIISSLNSQLDILKDKKPSGQDPRRIVLNLPLSLIDSLISPQGILHTHKQVYSTGPSELCLCDQTPTLTPQPTNKCDRGFFPFGILDFAISRILLSSPLSLQPPKPETSTRVDSFNAPNTRLLLPLISAFRDLSDRPTLVPLPL